jgi:hypothetical protein
VHQLSLVEQAVTGLLFSAGNGEDLRPEFQGVCKGVETLTRQNKSRINTDGHGFNSDKKAQEEQVKSKKAKINKGRAVKSSGLYVRAISADNQ